MSFERGRWMKCLNPDKLHAILIRTAIDGGGPELQLTPHVALARVSVQQACGSTNDRGVTSHEKASARSSQEISV